MHRRLTAFLAILFVSCCLQAPIAKAQDGFRTNAHLTYLGLSGGQQLYRYDYTVTNLSDPAGLTAFQVFFNSSSVSPYGATGDKATLVSVASPPGWIPDLAATGKNPDGQWSVNWDSDYVTPPGAVVLNASLSGFSVTFLWNDPNSLPPLSQHTQARDGQAYDYTTQTPAPLGRISGHITASCGPQPTSLDGVTVDLYLVDGSVDHLVATTATDATGYFLFPDLAAGSYDVVVVTPLGYVADANLKNVSLGAIIDINVPFAMTCLSASGQPRTIGYWKHQVNVYLEGKGSAQETLAQMVSYVDLLVLHFNNNIVNPVIVYDPLASGTSLQKLDQLLTVNKGGTALDRAKQQLLAVLLNVVSGKLSQTQVISADGANVSQAITYSNQLIVDAIASNDVTAGSICDWINNGQMVPAGVIPLGTPVIAYRRDIAGQALRFALDRPSVNPLVRGTTTIPYSITRSGSVELKLYDAAGRVVRTLAGGQHSAGSYHVAWDGTDDSGRRAGSGVYYARLAAPEGVLSRSIALIR